MPTLASLFANGAGHLFYDGDGNLASDFGSRVTGATATPVRLAGGTTSGAPTTGAHAKGEVVMDDTGTGWYCTVAGTPGTWVQIGAAVYPRALAFHRHVGGASVPTTSATYADVDAVNQAITFTVPADGRARIRITGNVYVESGSPIGWNLRQGAADVADTAQQVAQQNGASFVVLRAVADFYLTGLTAGASVTYKLGHARISGAGTVQTERGTLHPITMEAFSQPL